MKLYLVQHGEACAKEVNPDRPLTEKGKRDVKHLAQFLEKSGVAFDRVIHSGKLRAAQTAEIMASLLATNISAEISDQINPNDDPAVFNWRSANEGDDILVVGHLPFMARLVSWLLIDDPEKEIVAYQPGSIICLEFINNSRWQLAWMLRPELF